MPQSEKKTIYRKLTGTVVSDRMDKTVVVQVQRSIIHPRYKKRYKWSTKYKVHDPKNLFHTGEVVIFQACRPISRGKRWQVVYNDSKKS